MPFKSKAQRRKFAALLVEGEIDPETYEEWNRETGRKKLPERVRPRGKQAPGRSRARKKARKTAARSSGTRRGHERVARRRAKSKR